VRLGHGDGRAQPRPAATDDEDVAGEDLHRGPRHTIAAAAGVFNSTA
jgi:hypothetical protein